MKKKNDSQNIMTEKEGLFSAFKKGFKIADSKKVNLRYKSLKLIDEMVRRMYSPKIIELMDKEGYVIDEDSIKEAKASTKKKLIVKYLDGKTTKELSGAFAEIRKDLELLDI